MTPKPESGRPAVAVSPSQTISPAGLQRLASALEGKGLWPAGHTLSREAIAASVTTFQEREQLAATGYPDTETLRRLGLKPTDVAEAAQPQRRGTTP
ncbi:MAG: peptidoglycan-binding protein [Archangium sp.]|nr:peptidoglycan-binding protein [Archangium sp.]